VEAVRDLVRAREDARADLMRVRHRLSKLLLCQGRVHCGGHAWNGVNETWLRRQRFDDSRTTAAFDHHFDAVLTATAATDRLDEQIVTVAASPRWADQVDRLGCLRGISALTGLALTVEISDWTRFTGSSIGAYVGLVPTEYSSGTTRVQGSITKAGNAHIRRLVDRIGLASPGALPQSGADNAGPLGQGRPGAQGAWTRQQPAPAPAVVPVQPTQQTPRGGQRRRRSRARRLVLVIGHFGITQHQDDLIGIGVGSGEVSELDLRYTYGPQRDSSNLCVTPGP
jgi:hypothetical protein